MTIWMPTISRTGENERERVRSTFHSSNLFALKDNDHKSRAVSCLLAFSMRIYELNQTIVIKFISIQWIKHFQFLSKCYCTKPFPICDPNRQPIALPAYQIIQFGVKFSNIAIVWCITRQINTIKCLKINYGSKFGRWNCWNVPLHISHGRPGFSSANRCASMVGNKHFYSIISHGVYMGAWIKR